MASDSSSRSRSISLLVGTAALALLVWGGYAWRATRPTPAATEQVAATTADSKPTPLRATRPISEIIKKVEAEHAVQSVAPPADPVAEPPQGDELVSDAASAVRANSPSVGNHSIEMTISPKVAATPAPRLTESPAVHAAGPVDALALLDLGRTMLSKGDFIGARSTLSKALDRGLPPTEEDFIRTELGRAAEGLLFSRATNTGDPMITTYTVTSGDTLNGISARHGITEELLASVNQIKEANRLQVGQRLKVIRGPFRAVIDKSDHRMDIYLGDLYVRSFTVGLGANGYTPTGTWVVNNKLRNPDWTDPNTNRHYLADDPENPIGERWIGLHGTDGEAIGKTGFGIHGTIDASSIGQDKSMGCVRMAAADVNMVYELMVLNQSQVVIRP
ncbi:MAG: L,D-transpeptidase family protein [Planctomycetes bacterium]|nr:L,D-transpeptidase family protein [Planctomycetota bacterium]